MFAVFGLVVLVGCMTPSQQTTAYNTLYTTEHTVLAAVDAYDTAIIRGKVETNGLPEVSHAFNAWQASFGLAVSTVNFNTNALTPPALAVESADLINLITTLTKQYAK